MHHSTALVQLGFRMRYYITHVVSWRQEVNRKIHTFKNLTFLYDYSIGLWTTKNHSLSSLTTISRQSRKSDHLKNWSLTINFSALYKIFHFILLFQILVCCGALRSAVNAYWLLMNCQASPLTLKSAQKLQQQQNRKPVKCMSKV